MKKIILFSLMFLMFNVQSSFSTDTLTLKYFPLSVGNVYKYNYSSSAGLNYYYKVRIIKDTVINSKKYFITSGSFPGFGGSLIRVDSATGNLYKRFNSGYCSYSPYEILIDSLKAHKNDTAYVCDSGVKHICVDTNIANVLNMSVRKKAFERYNFEGFVTYSYGYGIGIFGTFEFSSFGSGGDWLVGAYINGVLYGDTLLTGIEKLNELIPEKYSLYQNYPNPFNPTTTIRFEVPLSKGGLKGVVSLKIFDILGKEVATLVNEQLTPGTYEDDWNASQFPSGIYFYKLTAGNFSETKKLILLK
ncbi:MAG TPA: T9SS type A sorting domain-containing protein [Ignavibacteria bacterium]